MPKIVYLSNSIIPSRSANSVHVMKMCHAFRSLGHQVVLLVPDKFREYETSVADVYEHYGVTDSFPIIRVPWRYGVLGKTYIYSALAAWRARSLQPDLVYSRHLVGAYFACKLGLKVIFESHVPADDSGMLEGAIFKRLVACKSLLRLVVLTDALREYYIPRFPIDEAKVLISPDGADEIPDRVEPNFLGNTPEMLNVGYVGQLYRGKGMEVIAKLAPHCPWAVFHVVGGQDHDIARWKAECSAQSNVVFHGHVPHSAIGPYLKAFDVVLLPNQGHVSAHGNGEQNISDWTSPLKLFEYMSAARPIVSSNIRVLREVLEDGRNALLCEPDDIHAWSRALLLLRNDPELRKRLGRQAHEDFSKRFTWRARARAVLRSSLEP